MTSIIVAVTRNGAIGKDNDLLYHISADLRRFKELTVGNTVIMGRRTFESLPSGALPKRKNVVVSRNDKLRIVGAAVVHSIEEAIGESEGEAFIIGGAEIYRQALPQADRLLLTEIDVDRPDADTFFPSFDEKDWKQTFASPWATDPKTGVAYRFRTLERC